MDLKSANKELEQLENEYDYWYSQKELAKNLIIPKSVDIKLERVEGGKREDRLLKYVELLDDKKIDDTMDYIVKRKKILIDYIDKELKRLLKYGEVLAAIIQLKENKRVMDEKKKGQWRDMTWDEIAKEVRWSKSYCRNAYRNYKKRRSID